MSHSNPLEKPALSALVAIGAESVSVNKSTPQELDISFIKENLPLILNFTGNVLTELPDISINDPYYFWGHPHISPVGVICISDEQGVVFDPNNINGIVDYVVQNALQLIEKYRPYSDLERQALFADELQDYLGVRYTAKWIHGKVDAAQSYYAEIYERKSQHDILAIRGSNAGTSSKYPSIRMELVETTIDKIPPINQKPDTAWLNQLIANHSGLKLSPKKIGALLVRVKNSYGYANFAVSYVRDKHTRINKLNFYSVREFEPDYYAQRGGGEVKETKIAIAGLGAIGSRVAEFLCLAGIKNLILIDSDHFSRDNLYRHILGVKDAGRPKVEALANHLNSRFLDLKIQPIENTIESCLEESLPDVDFLILTTGNIVVERLISSRAKREQWPFKIISGWVEPVGLGGHAFSMAPSEKGCLECLYIIDGQAPGNVSRVSLIEPNQKVTKNLMGCRGFLPYSALDAIKSALLVVDYVQKESTGYSRWVGSDVSAQANNIRTSEVYKNALGKSVKMVFTSQEIYESNCPCCNT